MTADFQTSTAPPLHGLHLRDASTRNLRILEARGEVDISNAGLLRDALIGHVGPARTIVLDVCHVSFMDSTGLSALLAAGRAATAEGGRLELHCSEGGAVHRVIELTKTSPLFDVRLRG